MVSNISKTEYFFYEWLIIEKGITEKEQFDALTDEDFIKK